MRKGLLGLLRCPSCGSDGSLVLTSHQATDREIRSGHLACSRCSEDVLVEHGVVDLLRDPTEVVRREAAGLARFAETMRVDGWDHERILNLPHDELGYWKAQAQAAQGLLDAVDFRDGASLLDVGSNTCWASNLFAQLGLEVVALDISTVEMQGLHTAEWWFDANGVYFERVLGDMTRPPFASGAFDYVFCSEVLHHNAKQDLTQTLRELYRVLKPGGTLVVVNEPLRFPGNLKLDHAAEVASYEGNEHVYFAHEYIGSARRAGFRIRLHEPATPVFSDHPLWLTRNSSTLGSAKVFLQQLLRRSRFGRRLLMVQSIFLGPDSPLAMLCRKPG